MMKNRRSYGQEGSGRRSYSRKPPVPRCTWIPTVPTWEKTFCKAVGSLDWEAFLDMKKYIYLYDSILKWNDSAVEEAFYSAKNRFWAELNGNPCNVDLPDPDLYIDDIDWDCQIDEGLLLDLECRSVPDSDEKKDTVIIFGDALIPDLPCYGVGWGTGWGDEEDTPKDQGNQQECTYDEKTAGGDQGNQQEYTYEKTAGGDHGHGAQDYSNNTWHLDKGDGWKSDWDKSQNMNPDFNSSKNRNYGSDGFWRKRNNTEATRTRAGMSRYNSSFHNEGHSSKSPWNNYNGRNQENYGWEQYNTRRRQPNGSSWNNYKGGNQENYGWEQNNTGRRKPNGGWDSNACRPNNRQAPDNARQAWNWKKSVS